MQKSQPYDRQKAQEIARKHLYQDQSPREQIEAVIELPREEMRQVMIAMMVGDI